MKLVAIGDIHGSPVWKRIVEKEKDADLFVFVGDYNDSYNFYSAAEEIYNFLQIVEFKKSNPDKVKLLIGNHDSSYMPGSVEPMIQGWDAVHASERMKALIDNEKYLQICFRHENLLFTHAGVSERFLIDTGYDIRSGTEDVANHLFALWKLSPKDFGLKPGSGGWNTGNDAWQSPLWIRPPALMASNKKSKIKKDLIQVVGHTHQNQIDIKGKATGGKYYFIDALGTSGEFLKIVDGVFTACRA
jgi:predicted phosphodiesterase